MTAVRNVVYTISETLATNDGSHQRLMLPQKYLFHLQTMQRKRKRAHDQCHHEDSYMASGHTCAKLQRSARRCRYHVRAHTKTHKHPLHTHPPSHITTHTPHTIHHTPTNQPTNQPHFTPSTT